MPGRPPKPTKILKLQGTARKDRHGRRNDLTLENYIPAAPDYFGQDALEEWQALVTDSQYSRVLARVDRGMMELYCALRAEFRKHLREGTEMPASRLTVMANAASKLGLNPSDRTKINMPQEPEVDDEFAALAAEIRGSVRAN
jgi:phage terminase small subunit